MVSSIHKNEAWKSGWKGTNFQSRPCFLPEEREKKKRTFIVYFRSLYQRKNPNIILFKLYVTVPTTGRFSLAFPSNCGRWASHVHLKEGDTSKSLSCQLQEPQGKGCRKSVRARGDGGHQANKSHCLNVSKPQMNSQRWKQQAQGQHGLPQICWAYSMASTSVFLWDS